MKRGYITPAGTEELMRSSACHEALLELNEVFRGPYEELLWASGPSPLAIACASIVSYGVKLSTAIDAVHRANVPQISDAMLRIPTENLANLIYILYVGPSSEHRTREDLAEQYLAFGDVQHRKLIGLDRLHAKQRIHSTGKYGGRSMTQAEFDQLQSAVLAKAVASAQKFATLGQNRWHSLSARDMIARVKDGAPQWLSREKALFESRLRGLALWNFALHASPFMFARDPSGLIKGELLNTESTPFCNSGHDAALMGVAAWRALAEAFGSRSEVERVWNEKIESRALEIMSRHLKPNMVRVP